MNSADSLFLEWTTYEVANFAVTHWHYSKKMPAGKNVFIGVWEGERFTGAVVFGTGAAPQAHCQFNIEKREMCELVRVALRDHTVTVSRVVAIALRMLRKMFPTLRLVVSYADPDRDHVGGIYQAGNWMYVGKRCHEFFLDTRSGKRAHPKTIRHGRPGYASALLKVGALQTLKTCKFKYMMPMDDAMRAQLLPLVQPYPKRVKQAMADVQSAQRRRDTDPPAPISDATSA